MSTNIKSIHQGIDQALGMNTVTVASKDTPHLDFLKIEFIGKSALILFAALLLALPFIHLFAVKVEMAEKGRQFDEYWKNYSLKSNEAGFLATHLVPCLDQDVYSDTVCVEKTAEKASFISTAFRDSVSTEIKNTFDLNSSNLLDSHRKFVFN